MKRTKALFLTKYEYRTISRQARDLFSAENPLKKIHNILSKISNVLHQNISHFVRDTLVTFTPTRTNISEILQKIPQFSLQNSKHVPSKHIIFETFVLTITQTWTNISSQSIWMTYICVHSSVTCDLVVITTMEALIDVVFVQIFQTIDTFHSTSGCQ